MSKSLTLKEVHDEYISQVFQKMDDSTDHDFSFMNFSPSKGYLKNLIEKLRQNPAMFQEVAHDLRAGKSIFEIAAKHDPELLYQMLLLNLVILRAPVIVCQRKLFTAVRGETYTRRDYPYYQPFYTVINEDEAVDSVKKPHNETDTICCVFAINVRAHQPTLAIPGSTSVWFLPFLDDEGVFVFRREGQVNVVCQQDGATRKEYTRQMIDLVVDQQKTNFYTTVKQLGELHVGNHKDKLYEKRLELKKKASVLEQLEGIIDQAIVEVACKFPGLKLYEREEGSRWKKIILQECDSLPEITTCDKIQRHLVFNKKRGLFLYL